MNSQLAELFASVQIDYERPGPARERPNEECLADLSVEDLFQQVSKRNWVSFDRVLPAKVCMDHEDYLLQQLSSGDTYRTILAFTGLGTLGTPTAFEAVKSYIEHNEAVDRRAWGRVVRAIAQMPASLALDTARRWFRRKEWHLQGPAGCILENHATIEDIPLLTEVLRAPETLQCEDCRLCYALNAFTLFEGFGPVPELEAVFQRVGYCYDRYRAAKALGATASVHFAADYAFECLWDSHWDTRGLGCETVDLSIPGALDRLRELAADPYEHPTVREVAHARLEDF